MEPLLMLMLAGALGGAVRSVLGYKNQAPEGEGFDYVKFGKSVVTGAIAGAAVVYYTFDLEDFSSKNLVGAFFVAVGADVLRKEFYGSLRR